LHILSRHCDLKNLGTLKDVMTVFEGKFRYGFIFFGKVLQQFFGDDNRAVRFLPAGRRVVLAVDISVEQYIHLPAAGCRCHRV